MRNLSEALALRAQGCSVIAAHAPGMPLPPGRTEADVGKFPLMPWKEFQERQPTEEEIRSWAAWWPNANLAVVTGKISGVIVLDVDGQVGAQTLSGLPPIPETGRSSTGRGEHIWFKHPGGVISNLVGFLPGLDLRGDGGYVVVPPSVHSSGRPYAWTHPDGTTLADPPEWLLELIQRGNGANGERVVRPVRIVEGKRNDTLYRLSRSLKVRGLSQAGILGALRAENLVRCEPPLPDAEVAEIARKAVIQADQVGFQPPNGLNAFLPPIGVVGNETNFAPIRADALLAQPTEPIPWVWESFIAEGTLNLLTAFMKVGKSTFLYPLAVATAQGKEFLGYETRASGVLILAVEEHSRDVRARLEKFGMQPEDPIYVHQGRLDYGEATMAALRVFITDHAISLVILDTLTRHWNIKDENDNAQVVRRCTPFLDLARETGCAVLLVHHDRKSGGEDGRAIRGGGALLGLVDQALMLDRRQGGNRNQRVLRTVGRYEETPAELILELQGKQYVSLGTAKQLGPEAAKASVWGALDTYPKTVDQLVGETRLGEKVVRQALKDLGESILQEGNGMKGSPYTYRQSEADSFPSQPHP